MTQLTEKAGYKMVLRLLLLCFLILNVYQLPVDAANITVNADGREVVFCDVQPFVKQGRVYLPVRTFVEQFGARVEWDKINRQVAVNIRDVTTEFTIDSSYIFTHNASGSFVTQSDRVPFLMHGRTFLPLRVLAETFGYQVNWDSRTSMVTMRSQSQTASTFITYAYLPFRGHLPNVRELEVFFQTNRERLNQNADPLALSGHLSFIARQKAKDMIIHRYFSHESPVYGFPTEMANYYGFDRGVGENIAAGMPSSDLVMSAWMDSPGHRENILLPRYSQIGVGYAFTPNDPQRYRHYWVQMFTMGTVPVVQIATSSVLM
ncbi:MAG: hypothetical protein KGZ45_05510 [Clostridium sp.]|nr:hypothetical protein [Clostridium sp.]